MKAFSTMLTSSELWRKTSYAGEDFCIFKISRTVLGKSNILPENTTMNEEGIFIEVLSLK